MFAYGCSKGKKGKNKKVEASYHVIRPSGNPGMLSRYPLGMPWGRSFSSPVYYMNVKSCLFVHLQRHGTWLSLIHI